MVSGRVIAETRECNFSWEKKTKQHNEIISKEETGIDVQQKVTTSSLFAVVVRA